jgi:hypothetical protein
MLIFTSVLSIRFHGVVFRYRSNLKFTFTLNQKKKLVSIINLVCENKRKIYKIIKSYVDDVVLGCDAWRWKQYISPKLWYLSTSPHGVTTQKNSIVIFTAVRTSNRTKVTSLASKAVKRPELQTDYWPLSFFRVLECVYLFIFGIHKSYFLLRLKMFNLF